MSVAGRVTGAGLVAIVAAAGFILSQSAPRRSGTDLTPNGAFVEALSRHQELCQGSELLPADTAAVQLTLGTFGSPGPAIAVKLSGLRGQTLAIGGLPSGWKQGVVRIPLSGTSKSASPASFCLRDLGPNSIVIAGDWPDPGYSLTVQGAKAEARRIRVDYLRPGRESWFELAPTIAHRFSLGKAGFLGNWAWLAAALLTLLASAAGAIAISRGHH